MKLFEQENTYMQNKKKAVLHNQFENETFLISGIWKMNDSMAMHWKDLRLALECGDRKELKKMKKGLKSVSDELIRIAREMQSYYEEDILEFEE